MHHISKLITFGSLGFLLLLIASVTALMKPVKKPKVAVGRVEFSIEIADEPTEWRRGLGGQTALQMGEGMLFVFPTATNRTFWMKNMNFPIDIIWIVNGKVVGYIDDVPADDGETHYNSPGPVDSVLEISAGERKRLGITLGAPVSVE